MEITLSAIFILLLYLVYERILLNSWLNAIPLRIAVTGTRGKSSVTRLIASILREKGLKVLAKTTGSEAQFILPDGKTKAVPRRGIPSIIEQKKLLQKAAASGVDCIVVEVMSIHPENHYVESQQMLQPNIVVVTNVRPDHTDAMGETEEEIASVFCLDIFHKAQVFIPQKAIRQPFLTTIDKAEGALVTVQENASLPIRELSPELSKKEFQDNLDLVYTLGQHMNIDRKTILNGLVKATHDIGTFRIWKYYNKDLNKTTYFVNGFSANDPESTQLLISKAKKMLPETSEKFIGILSLRSDRGDRTLQWLEALKKDGRNYFKKIYVTGTHARAVKRKLNGSTILKERSPANMMASIQAEADDHAVLFGFGSFAGTGRKLVNYWQTIGEEFGI